MPLARRLVHESVPILALPAPLPENPDLADLRPVLVIRQQQPAHHDGNGYLSTFDGDKPRGQAKPVLLEFHYIAGLHSAPTREDVFTAAPRLPVGLYGSQPHDLRSQDTTYVGARGEEITKRTFQLNVKGVLPELPELAQADPDKIARHVRHALTVPFNNAGDPRPMVEVTPSGVTRVTTEGEGVTSTVTVSAVALSRGGKHENHAEFIRSAVTRLSGQGIAGAGRVKSARLIDGGQPEMQGNYWGWRNVLIEVATECRQGW